MPAAAAHRVPAGAADPLAFHFHLVAWLAVGVLALAFALGVRRSVRRVGPAARLGRHQLVHLALALVAHTSRQT